MKSIKHDNGAVTLISDNGVEKYCSIEELESIKNWLPSQEQADLIFPKQDYIFLDKNSFYLDGRKVIGSGIYMGRDFDKLTNYPCKIDIHEIFPSRKLTDEEAEEFEKEYPNLDGPITIPCSG